MKTEPIVLQYPDLPMETKCKLYIQYNKSMKITDGRNDLFSGVKIKNIQRLVSKRIQANISKVIITVPQKEHSSALTNNTYVLYKAN